jgi:mannose-6-phosphate isomerase-like protein (cupin superfamily)
LEIEGIRVHLLRGQGVHVPPEACHQMRNLSSAPVRFLVISEPPSHGDRVSYIKPESEHHTIENMKGDS